MLLESVDKFIAILEDDKTKEALGVLEVELGDSGKESAESAPAIDDVDFVKEFVGAGKAKELGFKEEDADPEELAKGIEVEYEHTTNKEVAKRIALDHISESGGKKSNYYKYLAEMEARIKKELGESNTE